MLIRSKTPVKKKGKEDEVVVSAPTSHPVDDIDLFDALDSGLGGTSKAG